MPKILSSRVNDAQERRAIALAAEVEGVTVSAFLATAAKARAGRTLARFLRDEAPADARLHEALRHLDGKDGKR